MNAWPANARSSGTSRLKSPNKQKTSASAQNKRATAILERLAAANPDPHCELYFETPFQLLTSVILSAQTTDKSVNACMEPLYRKGIPLGEDSSSPKFVPFTPEHVVQLGDAALLQHIRRIGLAPTKARNVCRMAAILVREHGSKVPRSREELEALPGVGRKTASVVLGEIWGDPTIAVDTHVFRVTKRLSLHREKKPEACEDKLLAIIPQTWLPKAHHWFILHGRYTCTAQRPRCESCILSDLCTAPEKNSPEKTIKRSTAPKLKAPKLKAPKLKAPKLKAPKPKVRKGSAGD